MELRPEQLASAAGGQPLAPVYLVAGPETLRVLEAADALRAQVLDALLSGPLPAPVFTLAPASSAAMSWAGTTVSVLTDGLSTSRRTREAWPHLHAAAP